MMDSCGGRECLMLIGSEVGGRARQTFGSLRQQFEAQAAIVEEPICGFQHVKLQASSLDFQRAKQLTHEASL
jgi:hypothetical protein